MLLLTKSRISILSLLVILSLIYFWLGFIWLRSKLFRVVSRSFKAVVPLKRVLTVSIVLLLLGIWVVIVFSSGWLFSQVDERLANLMSAPTRLEEFEYFHPNEAAFELANKLAFAERIVYWSVGIRTFSIYPIFGVGPGNTGFFFERLLPPYGYQLVEIQQVLAEPLYGFPNPKNFWIRLLAENGIIGFSLFITWLLITVTWACVLWRRAKGVSRIVGIAGIFGAAAFTIEGMSLDTFALPQFWILIGMVAAVMRFEKSESLN
jgi:hypothetical protein